MPDTRVLLLRAWAEALVRSVQAGQLGKFSQLPTVETVSGPRVGVLEVNQGLETGKLLQVLSGNDAALARQFVPWAFPGQPSVFMAGRSVRIEVGWEDQLAEKDIRLAALGSRPHGQGRWIAGKSDTGTTVTLGVNGSTSPHFLIAGQTGSGKTEAMRSIVAQLSSDPENQLVLVDGKMGQGLAPLASVQGRVGPLAADLQQVRNALGWAVAEMVRRFQQGVPGSRIIVVMDEIQQYTGRTGDPAVTELVRRLVTQGREARVHCLIGTQHPVMESFSDSTIRANLSGRIALRTESYKASEVIVGGPLPRADHLLGSGDAYAITPQGTARVQLAYIPTAELTKYQGGQQLLDSWPEYTPDLLGLPAEESQGTFSPAEVSTALVQARLGSGRPALVRALQAAGLGSPGSVRAARLLKLGREVLASLQADLWDLVPAEDADCLPAGSEIHH